MTLLSMRNLQRINNKVLELKCEFNKAPDTKSEYKNQLYLYILIMNNLKLNWKPRRVYLMTGHSLI